MAQYSRLDLPRPAPRTRTTDVLQQGTSEAAEAIDHFTQIADAGLRAVGVLYDGAIQGKHQAELIRGTGMFVVNRIAAAERGSDGSKKHKRTLLDADACTSCGILHRYWAFKGAVCVEEFDATGRGGHLRELGGFRIRRRGSRGAGFRIYLEYSHTCDCSQTIKVTYPLHGSDEYANRGINLPENLRVIPEDSPHFTKVAGRRSDVESANNTMKSVFHGRRSRRLGRIASLVEVLGYAIFSNIRLRIALDGT